MFFKLILIFLILEIKKVFETNLKLIKNIIINLSYEKCFIILVLYIFIVQL